MPQEARHPDPPPEQQHNPQPELLNELQRENLSSRAAVNQYLEALNAVLSRNVHPVLNLGLVIDAYPFANVYRVASGAGGVHVCRLLSHTSTSLIGAADARTIPPGTLVWYFVIPGSTFGVIIGADPTFGTGINALNDIIFQSSSVGFFFDQSVRKPVQQKSFGIADFSGRNPEDLLTAGELCYVTETGGMLHLDSFMAMLRASEICGIWMFYLDSLLRIFGNHLQIWTGISQEEFYNDEGESYHYYGLAFYPREQLGILVPNRTVFTQKDFQQTRTFPGYSRVMPISPKIKPFHRFRKYSGYVAGGEKELVCLPTRQQELNVPINNNPQALIDIIKTADGQYGVRAIKSIHLIKTPVIYQPERIREVADPAGDREPEYQPSRGNHNLFGDIAVTYSIQINSAAINEATATVPETGFSKLFRWFGESGFYYHKKDFRLVSPAVTSIIRENGVRHYYLNHPEGTLHYDARTASISINEDSSISLIDGWNSSIRMTNNRIYLEAETIVLNCRYLVMPCPEQLPGDKSYITARVNHLNPTALQDNGIGTVYQFDYPQDALSIDPERLKQGIQVTVRENPPG